MNVRVLVTMLTLVLLLVVPAQAAPVREGGDEPTPSAGGDQGAQRTTVRQHGPVYGYPTADAPTVGEVGPGDELVATERIGDWYRIEVQQRAVGHQPAPLADGWVPGTVLEGPLDQVPPATQPTPAATPPAEAPPAEETITVDLPRSGGGRGGSGTPAAPGTNRQPVPVARPIIVQQCADANSNTACDVNEGIAGVTAYVLDAQTGQVLGQSISDERGIAQVYITVMSDAELVVNVPYLSENQSFRVQQGDVKPILVEDTVAIPGLLP